MAPERVRVPKPDLAREPVPERMPVTLVLEAPVIVRAWALVMAPVRARASLVADQVWARDKRVSDGLGVGVVVRKGEGDGVGLKGEGAAGEAEGAGEAVQRDRVYRPGAVGIGREADAAAEDQVGGAVVGRVAVGVPVLCVGPAFLAGVAAVPSERGGAERFAGSSGAEGGEKREGAGAAGGGDAADLRTGRLFTRRRQGRPTSKTPQSAGSRR